MIRVGGSGDDGEADGRVVRTMASNRRVGPFDATVANVPQSTQLSRNGPWLNSGFQRVKRRHRKSWPRKKISFIPSSLERHRSVGGAVQCSSLLGAGSGCCRLQEWSRRFISSIFNCRFVIWILLLKENQLIFSLSPLIF